MAIKIGDTTVINNSREWDIDFLPSSTGIDLGQTGQRWRSLYLSGDINTSSSITAEHIVSTDDIVVTGAITATSINNGAILNSIQEHCEDVNSQTWNEIDLGPLVILQYYALGTDMTDPSYPAYDVEYYPFKPWTGLYINLLGQYAGVQYDRNENLTTFINAGPVDGMRVCLRYIST